MTARVNFFLAEGFQDDCKALITLFCAEKSFKFSAFSKVWKQMNFDLVFSGRPTLTELFEFAEEIIRIAGYHILLDSTELNHRVGAIYLAHSLRLTQPMGKHPNIRVVPNLVASLKQLHTLLKERVPETNEALYVLCLLMRDGVFRYVMTEREYGVEKSYRKYLEDNSWRCNPQNENQAMHEELTALVLPGTGPLQNISTLAKLYHDSKCKLPGSSKDTPPKELDYVNKNFETDLMKSLQDLLEDNKQEQFEGHKYGVLKRTQDKISKKDSDENFFKSSKPVKGRIKRSKKSRMMDLLEYDTSQNNKEDIHEGSDNYGHTDSDCDDPPEARTTDMPVIINVVEDSKNIDLMSL